MFVGFAIMGSVGVALFGWAAWSLYQQLIVLEEQTLRLWAAVDRQQLEILGLIEERHGADAADAVRRPNVTQFRAGT